MKANRKTAARILAVWTDDASVADIAKRAGLSVATVRKYTDRFTRDEVAELVETGRRYDSFDRNGNPIKMSVPR